MQARHFRAQIQVRISMSPNRSKDEKGAIIMRLRQREEETRKYCAPVGQALILGVCGPLALASAERAGITAAAVSSPRFRISSNVRWLAPHPCRTIPPPRRAPKGDAARGSMSTEQVQAANEQQKNLALSL
jgi:hypothetical protein